jgi:SOS-response transcriptional repressor LexA
MEELREETQPQSPPPEQPAEATEDQRPPLDLAKLRRLRKGLRLTQAELAAHLGIHRTYLVLIEKGKKIPSPRLERSILEFMEKAEHQGVSPQQLWDQISRSNASHASAAAGRRVPVVSWAAAGQARAYEDLANQIEETVETESRDANSFAIIIEGDSMEHKFYAGDRVVFAPNSEPRNGDAVVAKLQDGRVFFKYFYRTGPEGARVKLVSENSNYGPLEFERSDFLWVYPGVEVKRRLRR